MISYMFSCLLRFTSMYFWRNVLCFICETEFIKIHFWEKHTLYWIYDFRRMNRPFANHCKRHGHLIETNDVTSQAFFRTTLQDQTMKKHWGLRAKTTAVCDIVSLKITFLCNLNKVEPTLSIELAMMPTNGKKLWVFFITGSALVLASPVEWASRQTIGKGPLSWRHSLQQLNR